MKRLQNKVALITGGTESIGKAIAELFIHEGAKVIICGRRDEQAGNQIANTLGNNTSYIKLNVGSEKDWQVAMDFIQQRFGRLNILVNNAGIELAPNTQNLQNPEDCSLSDWHYVHQINLDGVFLGCKYAIAHMKHQNDNSIVNIGSRSALIGVPSSAAYSSSKAAVRNYTKTVAAYCAQKNYAIRCNVIHPAAILTKLWDKEFGTDDKRNQRMTKFTENIPLKRMGSVRDVAQAALYFASPESAFITGTELIIDGGIMAGSAAAANEGLIALDDG